MTAIKSTSSSSSSSTEMMKMVPRKALTYGFDTFKLPSTMKRTLPSSFETRRKVVTIACPYGYNTDITPSCMTMKSSADGDLQSTNKRRKYMRRGSRCPSMLTMSALPLARFFEEETSSSNNPTESSSSSESNNNKKRIYDEKNAIAVLTEALNLSSSSFDSPMLTTTAMRT